MRTDGLRQGERDQTDYQATGFNSAFDAPFFGQRWDPGEKFTVDDARAQFDRFFGTQSPFANLSTPAARKVTQISTIRRRDGRMESRVLRKAHLSEFFTVLQRASVEIKIGHAGRVLNHRVVLHARSEAAKATSTSPFNQGHVLISTACRGPSTPGCRRSAKIGPGRGRPGKPVEERREKKGMTPLKWRRPRAPAGGAGRVAPRGARSGAQRDGPAGPRGSERVAPSSSSAIPRRVTPEARQSKPPR